MKSARPLKFWPFAAVGLTSFLIAKISLHPRLALLRDTTGWTLRYEYSKPYDSGPDERGLDIQDVRNKISGGEQSVVTKSPTRESDVDRNTSWILDTGANSHLCTNRDLMHSYTELGWGQTTLGFRGAGGRVDHHVGRGSCTLDGVVKAQGREVSSRVTLAGVWHYPGTGVNLLSWSALKRGAAAQGVKLKLEEADDWTLGVCMEEGRTKKQILRFRPQNGLYVLDQKLEAEKASDPRTEHDGELDLQQDRAKGAMVSPFVKPGLWRDKKG